MSIYTIPNTGSVNFDLTAFTTSSHSPYTSSLTAYTVPALSAVNFPLSLYSVPTFQRTNFELLPTSSGIVYNQVLCVICNT